MTDTSGRDINKLVITISIAIMSLAVSVFCVIGIVHLLQSDAPTTASKPVQNEACEPVNDDTTVLTDGDIEQAVSIASKAVIELFRQSRQSRSRVQQPSKPAYMTHITPAAAEQNNEIDNSEKIISDVVTYYFVRMLESAQVMDPHKADEIAGRSIDNISEKSEQWGDIARSVDDYIRKQRPASDALEPDNN